MPEKVFQRRKIIIRQFSKKDLASNKVKQFQDFVNALVEEDIQTRVNQKQTLRQEKQWLERKLLLAKQGKGVFLAVEHNGKIVGNAGLKLGKGRNNHVAVFWIAIRSGYRNLGLGTYLFQEIIKLGRAKLKPKPKIVKLTVYPTNQRAIKFYNRLGFKKAAVVPQQIQYKGKIISEIVMLKIL